jgi:hypothetical protein
MVDGRSLACRRGGAHPERVGNGRHVPEDDTASAKRWTTLPPRVEATTTSAEVQPVVPGSISQAPDWERDAMLKYGTGGV